MGVTCADVSTQKLRAWCKTRVDDMGPTATRVVDALVKWPEGGEPSQTVSSFERSFCVFNLLIVDVGLCTRA